MLNTNFTNIRDLQRNSKQLAEQISKSDKPTIVMNKNQPLFAIVSLKSLENLQQYQKRRSLQGLYNLARWVRENNIHMPADLGEKHNEYTWD